MSDLSLCAQKVSLEIIRILAKEQCSVKDARAAMAYIDKTIESNAVIPEHLSTMKPSEDLEKFFH